MDNIAIVLLAGFFLLVVFISGLARFSLQDFSRSRLEEICRDRNHNARFSEVLRHHETAMLAWAIVHITMVLAAASAAALWWGIYPGEGDGWDLQATLRLLSLMVVLGFVGVIFPWSVARVAGELFLYHFWRTSHCLLIVLRPLMWLANGFDTFLHRLAGREEPDTGDVANITEEILSVVDEGQREGVLESEARTMIHRVMELQEADVAEIMVPRTDMTSIQVDSTLEEVRQKLLEVGHSRVPIIGESPDDIIGVLYAKDLLSHLSKDATTEATLREIVREPFYIPETTGIDTLLQTMKAKRVHLAIVLDEYGGVAGLVTMEDILEEIVGEIVDEYDPAVAEQIHQIAPGITEVDARVHVDDINDRLELEIPEDHDYETIGGFAFSVLGRIPTTGESFDAHGAHFTILEADKRKVIRLRIEAERPAETAAVEK